VDGQIVAVLCLGSPVRRPYGPKTVDLLASVSPEIAIAVSNSLASRAQQELARVKAEFVAIASHELRTPLSVIKGYARLLLAPGFATDEDERRGYLERLYDGCDRLTRLVDDLLDAARIEQGKIPLRSDEIHVGHVLEQLAPVLSERYGTAPRLPAGERIVAADPVAVERILHNLLDNAYKYSESGTPPEVRWRRPSHAARLGVEVINDGAAFSPEELARLFQRFGRLPRHATRPGTGLGLYAARALVEQMGGVMGVESAGGRVAFWLELPAARLEAGTAAASTSTA
jgi:signal transduction histidine kinase